MSGNESPWASPSCFGRFWWQGKPCSSWWGRKRHWQTPSLWRGKFPTWPAKGLDPNREQNLDTVTNCYLNCCLNHPLGRTIKNCNPSSHWWPLKWRGLPENGGSHLWWRLLCWPGPARPGYSVVPLQWGRESQTSGRSIPQTLWCLSPWQHLDNEERVKKIIMMPQSCAMLNESLSGEYLNILKKKNALYCVILFLCPQLMESLLKVLCYCYICPF